MDKEPGTGVMMTNAVVSYNGEVFWAAPAIFKSSCSLDITYFPFDRQTCRLKFGPWAYKSTEVVMKTEHGKEIMFYSDGFNEKIRISCCKLLNNQNDL